MAEAEDDGGLQDGECVTVTFAEEGGLGLNFVPALWPAIESIDPDSMASRAEGGALRAGMILVDVQGEDMNGKSLAEAGAAFQKAGRPLRLTFQDVPEHERRMILGENAAKLYGFDLDALRPLAEAHGPTPEMLDAGLDPKEIPEDSTCYLFAAARRENASQQGAQA